MEGKINPRFVTWEEYGISKKRYKELKDICSSGQAEDKVLHAARKANSDIAEHIVESVKKNKSYEKIEYDNKLGRIPCGRTDFYGYRRLFYHLLDEDLKFE
ncbi:MAG: hypothetical protein IJO85_07440 [Lachnospiraceae bacterium]|nr:hypothetical protein [Lachnospiraceae bacterium]